MAVKLELYRVFHEVARMGNISAAAQNLFISQSAVSQSIKQLEEQLQVRLFSRSTKGVYLTSEGKLLQEYISHALGLIQSGEEKLAQSRQLLTGELIIGASDTVTKTARATWCSIICMPDRWTSPLPATIRTRQSTMCATVWTHTRSLSPRRITRAIFCMRTRWRRLRRSR